MIRGPRLADGRGSRVNAETDAGYWILDKDKDRALLVY
jgi:hypothetical protein